MKKVALVSVILGIAVLAFVVISNRPQIISAVSLSSMKADSASPVPALEAQVAFNSCFNENLALDTPESILRFLDSKNRWGTEQLVEESYELEGSGAQRLVVQYLPQEPDSVRVFKISPQDGLPDRLSEFPDSGAEVSLRLNGALSLGTLKAKTTTVTRASDDESELTVSRRESEITEFRFVGRGVDFECQGARCRCAGIQD